MYWPNLSKNIDPRYLSEKKQVGGPVITAPPGSLILSSFFPCAFCGWIQGVRPPCTLRRRLSFIIPTIIFRENFRGDRLWYLVSEKLQLATCSCLCTCQAYVAHVSYFAKSQKWRFFEVFRTFDPSNFTFTKPSWYQSWSSMLATQVCLAKFSTYSIFWRMGGGQKSVKMTFFDIFRYINFWF